MSAALAVLTGVGGSGKRLAPIAGSLFFFFFNLTWLLVHLEKGSKNTNLRGLRSS